MFAAFEESQIKKCISVCEKCAGIKPVVAQMHSSHTFLDPCLVK
jgi:hypothetical protein